MQVSKESNDFLHKYLANKNSVCDPHSSAEMAPKDTGEAGAAGMEDAVDWDWLRELHDLNEADLKRVAPMVDAWRQKVEGNEDEELQDAEKMRSDSSQSA